jgi:hypothetical protein
MHAEQTDVGGVRLVDNRRGGQIYISLDRRRVCNIAFCRQLRLYSTDEFGDFCNEACRDRATGDVRRPKEFYPTLVGSEDGGPDRRADDRAPARSCFLAGAELDPAVFRAKRKEAGAVGFVSFFVTFAGCDGRGRRPSSAG